MARVEHCVAVVRRITGLLNGRHEDVLEFKVTVNFVHEVLSEFTRNPLSQVDLGHVFNYLSEYETLLRQLVTENKVRRLMTNNRLRKKLELVNSNVHTEVSNIFLHLRTKARPRRRDESVVRLLNALGPQARDMWETAFQDNPLVPWGHFMTVYREAVRSPVNESGLRYLLDNSGTNHVNLYKFSEFLKGFGPLLESPHKVHEVVSADWFHGYLSSDEAFRLLAQSPVNTYLVRISKSRLGAFALAYVKSRNLVRTPDGREEWKNDIVHTLISTAPTGGFKIDEQVNNSAKDRIFASLSDVVKFYSHMLKTPFNSNLAREAWFHGEMSSIEATEMLADKPDGTFLFRFSSYPGFLAVSYVENRIVQHGKVEVSSLGFRFETEQKQYLSLQALVEDYRKLLKEPLSNTPFPSAELIPAVATSGYSRATRHSPPSSGGSTHYQAVGHIVSSAGTSPVANGGIAGGVETNYAPLPMESGNSRSGRASPLNHVANMGGAYGVVPGLPVAGYGKTPGQPPVISGYGKTPGKPSVNANGYGHMPGQPTTGATQAPTFGAPSKPSVNANGYGHMPGQPVASTAAAPALTDGYGKIPNAAQLQPVTPGSALSRPSDESAAAAGYGVIPVFENNMPVTNEYGSIPVTAEYGSVPQSNVAGAIPT